MSRTIEYALGLAIAVAIGATAFAQGTMPAPARAGAQPSPAERLVNPLSETQAKSRLQSQGYTDIDDLVRFGDQWKGKAKKDGQTVDLSIDSAGQVTAAPPRSAAPMTPPQVAPLPADNSPAYRPIGPTGTGSPTVTTPSGMGSLGKP